MATPQKFDDFITQLREELTNLYSQKNAITSELVTLAARKQHLEGSIAAFEKQSSNQKSEHEKTITELTGRIRELNRDKVSVEKAISWLEDKHRIAVEVVEDTEQAAHQTLLRQLHHHKYQS